MKRKICIVLAWVFAAVFVFSAVNLCLTIADYRQAEELYNDVQVQYVSPVINPSTPEQDETTEEELISVDFDGLLSSNSDVVGWLYAPDTNINYPVVQAKDNETYLQLLDEKLREELAEYQESKSLEELADLLEVMEAVVVARGYTWEQLQAVKAEKKAARGGFAEKLLLLEVSE